MSTAVGTTLCVPRPSSGLNPNQPMLVKAAPPAGIPPHHVLIEVDRFGFSANNVTYQALGEAPHFRYFEYHYPPTTDVVSSKTHGLIPVWGFGTVVLSTSPSLPVGERVYGYLAPTTHLLVPISHSSSPSSPNVFIPRPHLPPDRRPYNTLTLCSRDPQYVSSDPHLEDLTMLYRPLFWTAFWCEDWLHASGYRGGARRVLISSASAKTAFCLAYLIRKRKLQGMKVVGLTSKRNLAFTNGLGLYDEVSEYDSFASSNALNLKDGDGAQEEWIYIDVAGNDDLNNKIFAHYKGSGKLTASIQLGLSTLSPSSPEGSSTKWTTNTALEVSHAQTPKDAPTLEQFFMPEWLTLRRRQLPTPTILSMQNKAWAELMQDGKGWVRIERTRGENVRRAYERVASNGVGAEVGEVWSLWDVEEKGVAVAKL
ncbi:hypothetical protein PUNSTDRAFT_106993 [Punctularia strigosozonata HHB-11173 SS5]|uniref:uncharacterized protein n=1 Tax=Punctularia strigosozonata (strain HHB-11173) TaxID=741275 RepID=UPI00044179DF|nr:uncharacterized protein PUNSTDRAFT_106993 [Punctularia strigosozonata HHB-11173 SS5]EIN05342.1 hypothetical protein PUNSTDRAFT_106993 [Punctularia strigosozonata HHB-11173 SS5]